MVTHVNVIKLHVMKKVRKKSIFANPLANHASKYIIGKWNT